MGFRRKKNVPRNLAFDAQTVMWNGKLFTLDDMNAYIRTRDKKDLFNELVEGIKNLEAQPIYFQVMGMKKIADIQKTSVDSVFLDVLKAVQEQQGMVVLPDTDDPFYAEKLLKRN
jgi:hypothetical protein